ncbi:hypothetical protein HNR33_003753 [Brassicibacter mesophilus]
MDCKNDCSQNNIYSSEIRTQKLILEININDKKDFDINR